MFAPCLTAIGCAAAILGLAGAAQAESTADVLARAVRPAPALRSREAPPDRLIGVAQTSVDRRFEHGRADAALGFLCGRPEDRSGRSARVFGDDPQGRFLGARLSLAVR